MYTPYYIYHTLRRAGIAVLVLFSTVLCTSCGSRSTQQQGNACETKTIPAPPFDADSAYAFTAAQCAFGPRVPGSNAHRLCGDYIVQRFKAYGAEVTEQKATVTAYDNTRLPMHNIIASVRPEATSRVLLCGHWDSRPWADNDPNPDNHHTPVLAANDAASDVAVMLEVCRQLQIQQLQLGVDFICFDVEDYGTPQWAESDNDHSDTWCLGSQYWAEHPHTYNYRPVFGILMDMVGGQGATFAKEGYSQHFAPQVVELVWNTAARLGHSQVFVNRDGGYVTDDHVPVNRVAGIPCIDIVPNYNDGPSSFGPTWHTVSDNMEHIDKATLKAVGQTVMQVLYEMDN